jgi:hypothetical protein
LSSRPDDTGRPVWDDTIGTVRPTDKRRTRVHHVDMPGTSPAHDVRAFPAGLPRHTGDEQITVRDRRRPPRRGERPALRLVENRSPILIVGRQSPRRDALLADLTETLPPGTRFEELSSLGDMLERAAASRMVILDGGLPGVPAGIVARMLAQRHPRLPVIRLDPPNPDDL